MWDGGVALLQGEESNSTLLIHPFKGFKGKYENGIKSIKYSPFSLSNNIHFGRGSY